MNTLRTRIARLTAASVLVVGLGALASGPALAADASPDSIGRGGGIKSVVTLADNASPDSIGRPGGISSVGNNTSADPAPLICHPSIAPCGA